MLCEQKTWKATESQSPSSLSWQSTAVVADTGAARGAPPAQESLNPSSGSAEGGAEEPCPPWAVTPLRKEPGGNNADIAVPPD